MEGEAVNDKFFNLPKDKQRHMLDAGFKVFANNPYKKANTAEIAAAAGISKGLLFHYFDNKQGLYEYLFHYGTGLMTKYISEILPRDETDLFEIWLRSHRAKTELLKKHPHLMGFLMRVYYDKAPENQDNMGFYDVLEKKSVGVILSRIDRSKFREDVDPEKVVKWLILTGEGYLKRQVESGKVDLDSLENEFTEYVLFMKKNSYKEEVLL